MTHYTTEDIRNIALLGPAGSGKTELIEALLQHAGMIKSRGSIDRGTTVSDYDPQERSLGHSLNTTICNLDHDGNHINLIDTPGYPDLLGRALAALPAVETAAVVINAQIGIEMVTQQVMEHAAERNLCRLIIINQIDAAESDLEQLLGDIRERFGKECLPLNLPARHADAVVDCFFHLAGETTDFSSVPQAHSEIIDQVVEVDEALMNLYLEQGEELSPEQLHDPFEQALREGHLIPVCFVSARSGAGIAELLQIFDRLMPNPNEGNPPLFYKGEGDNAKPVTVTPSAGQHVIAHLFKIDVDPFIGKLGVFRIHQGTIAGNSQLFIGDGRKPFRVAHLLSLQGKTSSEITTGIPGDICAVAKVDAIHRDAVLHDSHDEDYFHLQPIKLPPPMMGIAIEPLRRGDEQKLSDALHKIEAEDPSIVIEHNAAANETILRGMGELHLRVVLEQMKSRYHADLATHTPSIAYRETIQNAAEGHHRHKKQTGGAGQFGEVFLRIRPREAGSDYLFLNQVVGGAIPAQFILAVEKGVRQIINDGAIAGYPMQAVEVELYDGKFHPVDSKEIAFIAAGKRAFLNAVEQANPVVLEPVVSIEITIPTRNIGDISGDLAAKHGHVNGTASRNDGTTVITGQVPLAALDEYPSTLKSLTGGKGSYTLAFSHYQSAPAAVQKALTTAFHGHQDD